MDGKRNIGDQRPGSRRPHEQRRVIHSLHFQFDVHTGFFDVFIAHCDFVRRQRRFAARAVGLNLVSLVNQSGVEIFFQRPPDRLHVVRLKRNIGRVEIDPIAHLARQGFPIGLVLPDRFLALFVELLDAVCQDVIFVLHPEHLFNFDFHRQSVRIPSRFTMHLIARHGLVAADGIFQRTSHDMMDTGAAVRSRRSFVK